MRGKVGHARENHVESGITPAYAGKSQTRGIEKISVQDHPRLCGEKAWAEAKAPADERITPAYAGKSGRLRT